MDRSSSSVSVSPASSAASRPVRRSSSGAAPPFLEQAVEVVHERHEGEDAALDRGVVEVAVEHAGGVELHGPNRC